MNDIKLLDFPQLARDFQQIFVQLRDERLALAQRLAERKYRQQWQQTYDGIQNFDSEAGSDGIAEAVTETLGEFDPDKVELSVTVVQQCKQEARAAAVEAWAIRNMIPQKLSWLPHQLLAYFGTWTAVRDDAGKYSAPLSWDANTRQRNDYYALGSALLATSARTNFFKDAPKGNQQYKSVINPMVPIILAGFKKFQGIKYSDWSLVGLETLLDQDLAKLVGVTVPEIPHSELIALRNTARTKTFLTRTQLKGVTNCIRRKEKEHHPKAGILFFSLKAPKARARVKEKVRANQAKARAIARVKT